MAGEVGKLYVTIGAKIDELQKALKEVKQQLGGTEQEVKKTNSAFSGLWKQFAIGQIVVDGAKKAIRLFTDTLGDAIKGAIESEQSEKNLETALASTGRTVEKLLPAYLEFSKAQSRHVKYTDEEINAAQTLLVQMTSLDTQGIQRATKGAMGLASVMGISLQSATMLVTKAMEGNYGALSRYGIKVDENLTLQEKNAELLRQLDGLYTRAEAEVNTFGGALGQLKKEWGELLEEAGKIITQNPAVVAAINDVKKMIIDLIESGDLKKWAEEAGRAITLLAQVIRDTLGAIKNIVPAAFKVINQELLNLKTSIFLASAAWAFLTKRSDEYQEFLYNLKKDFLGMNQVLGDHDIKLDEVGATTNEVGNKTTAYTTATKKAADAVKEHKDELKDFKMSLADCSVEIGEMTTLMRLWGDEAEDAADIADRVGDAAIEIGRKMDQGGAKAEEAAYEHMSEVSTIMTNFVQDLSRDLVGILNLDKIFGFTAKEFDDSYFKRALSEAEDYFDGLRSQYDNSLDDIRSYYDGIEKAARKTYDDARDLVGEEYDAKAKAMRRDYEDRRDWIQENVKDEGQRKAMLKKLDRDYEDSIDHLKRQEKEKLKAIEAKHQRDLDAMRGEQKKKEDKLKDDLVKIEEDKKKEMDRIRRDEDIARDALAEREKKRQNSLWTKLKETFGKVCGDLLSLWISKFINPMVDQAGEGTKGVNKAFSLIDFAAVGAAFVTLGSIIHQVMSDANEDIKIDVKGHVMSVSEMIAMWHMLGLEIESVIYIWNLAEGKKSKEPKGKVPGDPRIKPKTPGGPTAPRRPPTIPAATGVDMIVHQPTLFMAGEGGLAERVTVTPNINMNMQAVPVNINVNGKAFLRAIANDVYEMTKTREIKLHSNATVNN